MTKLDISTKRVAISKANAQTVAFVAVASFVTVFCLVATQAMWSQNAYERKVVSAKEKANRQLKANIQAVDKLMASYKKFTDTPNNVIGGSTSGTGDNDGNNAKIILDALPSSYDFPALTSSIEKILNSKNLKVGSITGTDDEVAQAASQSSATPQPVPMTFTFVVDDASYESVQDLVKTLELSIRPIQVDSIDLSGAASKMNFTVNAHTFYQPPKALKITKQVIQ